MSLFDVLNHSKACEAILRRLVDGQDLERCVIDAEKLLREWDESNEKSKAARNAKEEQKARRRKLGKVNSGLYEIAPACEEGVDHGVKGIVLMRNAKGDRLVWRPGSKYFGGIGRQAYAPADLEVLVKSEHRRMPIDITGNHASKLGGDRAPVMRLSRALFQRYREAIDKHMGEGSATRLYNDYLKGTIKP